MTSTPMSPLRVSACPSAPIRTIGASTARRVARRLGLRRVRAHAGLGGVVRALRRFGLKNVDWLDEGHSGRSLGGRNALDGIERGNGHGRRAGRHGLDRARGLDRPTWRRPNPHRLGTPPAPDRAAQRTARGGIDGKG
ncbi:MAG: hypothetical protein ACR2MB_14285 [Acidimicrobiales bacterium]